MNDQTNSNANDAEQPFIAHLIELRDRVLRMLLVILLIFLALFPFANDLYTFLAEPLLAHLPEGGSMIATEVTSPFLTPFKLTLVLAIFIAIPYLLYQLWAFVAPGIYQHEKRLIVPLLVSSTLLFYAGMVFAYYVVFPLVFGFFTSVAPEGVAVMTDIAKYLDFVLKLFFAFGIAFEVPVVVVLLIITGASTVTSLQAKRPYIIVGVFVIGMFLTPPDVISQTLLALPMWLLFEFGLWFSRYFQQIINLKEDEAMEQMLDQYESDDKNLR
ncbi:twin-arginine translocase subunit TatC [Ectothiorhodospiraceae bacterium BW-2]|nr:twin-arginine translocase subunit TatC [Ectothiorhodospiraceae bacterium BW-2]